MQHTNDPVTCGCPFCERGILAYRRTKDGAIVYKRGVVHATIARTIWGNYKIVGEDTYGSVEALVRRLQRREDRLNGKGQD